jgi:hypothetical protein
MEGHSTLHFKIRKCNALDKHELVADQEGHITLAPHC